MSRLRAGAVAGVCGVVSFVVLRFIAVDVRGVWGLLSATFAADGFGDLGEHTWLILVALVLGSLLVAAAVYQVLRNRISIVFSGVIFIIYLISLVAIVMFKSVGTQGINLNPLDVVNQFSAEPVAPLMNIVIFVPLGMISRGFFRARFRVLLTFFFVILSMEILQYVLHLGFFDVVDIILNCAGFAGGYLLLEALGKKWKLKRVGSGLVVRVERI